MLCIGSPLGSLWGHSEATLGSLLRLHCVDSEATLEVILKLLWDPFEVTLRSLCDRSLRAFFEVTPRPLWTHSDITFGTTWSLWIMWIIWAGVTSGITLGSLWEHSGATLEQIGTNRTFHKLPHIPQITTTEAHRTVESLRKNFRRLIYIPHIPQAIAHSTNYHDWAAWDRGVIQKKTSDD